MQQQTNRRKVPTTARKLYSIHMLLRGAEFAGQIETPRMKCDCRFRPLDGTVIKGRLQLNGDLSVVGLDKRIRTVERVIATLAAMQSGFGAPPTPPERYAASRRLDQPTTASLPVTESTDAAGYAGVLYFDLSPLNARALGLANDMTDVQINLRMAPVSQEERELQWLLSSISGALLGSVKDESLASEYLAEFKRALKA